ncbi:MAG: hypothetical protein NZ920_01105 [Aigarchaeota archaeon]|nr:hypothetical protein [Aigarchaeota archaeon]MDW8093039.1 hypothetical protein [Nitrososphaerota archaeon]
MISFVTTLKPLTGRFNVIQLNAIRSWLRVCNECEIVVVGDEEGVEGLVRRYQLKHVKEVRRAPSGAPYLDDLLRVAEGVASFETICLINADIILLRDFLRAYHMVRGAFDKFVVTSRRFDLPINYEVDFNGENIDEGLRNEARRSYVGRVSRGTDLFLFKKDTFINVPPLIIGRLIWSRWFILEGLSNGIPVIDATPVITAIHQTHDYAHIKDERVEAASKSGLRGYDAIARGLEYKWNSRVGSVAAYFSEADCNYVLTPDGPVKRSDLNYVIRHIIKYPLINQSTRRAATLFYRELVPSKRVRALVKKLGFRSGVLY